MKENSRFVVLFLFLFFTGCGNMAPLPGNSVNEAFDFDLTDPDDIARWEASSYNFYHSKIKVVPLNYFHGLLGSEEAKPPQKVGIEICEAQTNGIAPEQQQALDDFIEHEKEIHAAVRKAVYQYYQEAYPAFKQGSELGKALYGGTEKIDDIIPPIKDGTELDSIVEFTQILIHPVIDGKAPIGIELFGNWDENYGIGIQLLNGEVTDISNAYGALPAPKQK
ncbi:hypothetical protein [uncultured Gimesia sp.]|jgi:hypothetical protein|uniref:DUF6985 domain-containing protein n=1 Tax=uncultured Gimesia sp. TaxID=1678688 RepID=UPI00263689FA|nr:hypothetical protein [uncultured Gimesia sp.]